MRSGGRLRESGPFQLVVAILARDGGSGSVMFGRVVRRLRQEEVQALLCGRHSYEAGTLMRQAGTPMRQCRHSYEAVKALL